MFLVLYCHVYNILFFFFSVSDLATVVQLVPLEVVVMSPQVCASVPLEQMDVRVTPASPVTTQTQLDIVKVASFGVNMSTCIDLNMIWQ